MSLVRNEQTKLLANALDRASTASLAVGVFGPISANVYASDWTKSPGFVIILTVSLVWIIVAIALHIFARRILKGLVG
jgi:hypothetical protein